MITIKYLIKKTSIKNNMIKSYINKKNNIKKLLNNICGHSLDKKQRKIVVNNSKHTLVVAGAGSGKSLTIIGKIRYLIEIKKIKENEILCISFTNESTNSLKEKLKKNYNYEINVLTFHKLSLKIINNKINIVKPDYLNYVIGEYLESNKEIIPFIIKYFELEKYNKDIIINIISSFINLYKSTYSDYSHYKKILRNTKNSDRNILKIIYQIQRIYDIELESTNSVDFNDMLHMATKLVKSNKFDLKYKYIIIDEYQDTSYIRFLLIKSIINKTGAHFLAVGDDFQSIYRFTGCNLNMFLNFKKYFKFSKIMKIENTYRNPQELISVAGSFIMKNKRQIKKKLKSNIHNDKPIICVYYNNKKEEFKKLINYIYKIKNEIMILGRNNNDIYSVIDNDFDLDGNDLIYKKNPKIRMKYYTVHKSKGLEANNVIIINMDNTVLGFPSKLKDHKILRYVINQYDFYPYEEERRLFYVALTRTKESVYLLTPRTNKSIFFIEIENNYKIAKLDL